MDSVNYVVGVASVWYNNKGIKDYIKLAHQIGNHIKVVLVGNGLNSKELRRHGIMIVPRTENIEELAAIYTSSKVVLNLSYQESFGLTSVEGYGCGKPTIVFNCTASPELVEIGKTGFVVEAGDTPGLVQAIGKILEMDQEKLSKECRQRAIDLYDKNNSYKKYLELYDSLVNF